MKVFVTGATGYVGKLVVEELLKEGHQVTGLVRSEDSANYLKKLGVRPVIGNVKDVATLEKEAKEADAVIHLAFDFNDYEQSVKDDTEVMKGYHRALKGTGKPVLITTATLTLGPTEVGKPVDDTIDILTLSEVPARGKVEQFALGLAKDDLNISVFRLACFVYGENGSHFTPFAIQNAKKHGVSYYAGDGLAHFTAVDVRDAAKAYVLGITKAKAGAGYNVVGENNVSMKEFAEAVGKLVGVETKSIPQSEAEKVFGPLAYFFTVNHQATASRLSKDLGWVPETKVGILEDIANGSYKA